MKRYPTGGALLPILNWLKTEHGRSRGNANRVATGALKPAAALTGEAQIDAIYSGRNAAVRPLQDQVVETVHGGSGPPFHPVANTVMNAAQLASRLEQRGGELSVGSQRRVR